MIKIHSDRAAMIILSDTINAVIETFYIFTDKYNTDFGDSGGRLVGLYSTFH